ncbi:MAG: UDP-N-acetylmuramate dehydrogenase [Candidatus Omnitrophica bacterium]|nr:UDP-N-acetylmuramate dehydrogenase [Candidatus Omnitrophota bacterium]
MNLKKLELLSQVNLSKLTTIRIGGVSELFFRAQSLEDLRQFILDHSGNIRILGNGSNLLIKNKIIREPVLKLGEEFSYIRGDRYCLEVGAGTMNSLLQNYCLKENLGGLEYLAGIPATVGGMLRMNASSFDCAISDRIIEIVAIDRQGNLKTYFKEDISFKYRSSSLSDCIIVAAKFRLSQDIGIHQKINLYLKKRLSRQDFKFPSCGCVFKNPQAESAGALIDSCGLKGRLHGGAQVSNKHANFIVNLGNAIYDDVDYLINTVKEQVYKKHNLLLEEEVIRWT